MQSVTSEAASRRHVNHFEGLIEKARPRFSISLLTISPEKFV